MKVLINVLGIQDSGGITVFEKVLEELLLNKENQYIIIANNNLNINILITKYKNIDFFEFITIPSKGFLHRLYYENIKFKIIIEEKILT